ncbi:MAG: hypothetical protein NXI24_24280 [bacterium]|nr:hypothetical protein [bacterium]
MLNSFTNALHATALIIYTVLVYWSMQAGDPLYTIWIFLTFLFVAILKILGMIVHLPQVDHVRERHNFFWILISIGLVFLNYATLIAIHAPLWALVLGMVITVGFVVQYIRTLLNDTGHFVWIALAMTLIYLLCTFLTTGMLQLGWICTLISQILWIGLERVPYLEERKYHNDIYHFALIGSTYLLFKSIETGLWEVAATTG